MTKNLFKDEEAEFEESVAPVREAIDAFLTKHYGPRCGAYEPECACCIKWKHRDELLDNPFNDEPASPELPLEVYEEEPKQKKIGPKRKLDTPEEINSVCRQYHLSTATVSQIARRMKVSQGVIDRVLKESGPQWCSANAEEVEEYRSSRYAWTNCSQK